MAGKTVADRKAERDATVAAKLGAKQGTKAAKVPVRQQAGGAPNGSWNTNTKPATIDPNKALLRRQFKRRASKVLFFVRGAMPSSADMTAADAIGPGVVFRNALKIVPGAPLENCDAVAGAVPDDYAEVFPAAEDNHVVDEENRGLAAGVVPPQRSGINTGNTPDDARPGTVARFDPETGKPIGHASGTGSEMSGGINPHPMAEGGGNPDATIQPTVREQAAVWKSNKVD